jgi:hypothetical protein
VTNLRFGLTTLCLGLVADSGMEKSYMRFIELNTEIDVLCSQEFDAMSR